MTAFKLILAFSIAVLLAAGTSTAAASPGGTHVAQNDADVQAKRQQVMQRIRDLRAQKLTEALNLDQATRAKLLPIIERYDSEFARLLRDTHALRRQVRKLVKSGATDAGTNAEINRLIDRMTALQRELWSQQEARFRDVRKVLTPQQAAAIFVVLPKLDRKIHRQVRRALRGRRKHGRRHQGPR